MNQRVRWLLGLGFGLLWAGAACADGPGRIAVAGPYPVGYVGCLARYGLPHDLLGDWQCADLATLRRYDLLVLAGTPAEADVTSALRQYVEGGGALLVDCSSTAVTVPNLQLGERVRRRTETAQPLFVVKGMSRAEARPTAGSPLAPLAGPAGGLGQAYVNFVPDTSTLAAPRVLAEYPTSVASHAPPATTGTGVLERLRISRVDLNGGPSAPAIVSGGSGAGRVVLCGLQLGLGSALMQRDFDALMLALVREATGRRAVSQVRPAVPRVWEAHRAWAEPALDWLADGATSGLFRHRAAVYGDCELSCDLTGWPDGAAVSLLLDSAGEPAEPGTELRCARAGAVVRLGLWQRGALLQSAEAAWADALVLTLRRRTDGAQVRLEGLLGERSLVGAGVPGARGAAVGFRCSGWQPAFAALALRAPALRTYTGAAVPPDWVPASGLWGRLDDPARPGLCGYSDQAAVLWTRPVCRGEVMVDYEVRPMVLNERVPGYFGAPSERVGDFNVNLCGDGRSVDSGYSFRVGTEAPGPRRVASGRWLQLLRAGRLVAEQPRFALPSRMSRRWVNLRAERRGAVVALRADGQLVLEYRDPEPLPDGRVALWTQRNGICVPRLTLAAQAFEPE